MAPGRGGGIRHVSGGLFCHHTKGGGREGYKLLVPGIGFMFAAYQVLPVLFVHVHAYPSWNNKV